MTSKKPEVIAIVGPTATGKTLVGAAVAKHLQSQVISVDSQLVYDALSIGVARPTEEEMQGVPHHMIGVVPPTSEFSASTYTAMARPILDELLAKNKIPVLAGGTGFYLRALLQPAHVPEVPQMPGFRQALFQRAEREGRAALYQELQQKDPQRATELYANDLPRIVRALEIIEYTGKPVQKTPQTFAYPTLVVGLTYADREAHIRKIRIRLEEMVAAGFLAEVEQLYTRYGNCHALQKAHGYPELLDVLLGKRSLEDALDQVEINIRQYSKRQMTWFKRLPDIQWFYVDQTPVREVITAVIDGIV